MNPAVRSARNVFFSVAFFGLVPAAYGATLYAANNGVDGPTCGASASPCRSITQTMANAVAGDTIMVRPGRYSSDGGQEVPSFGGMVTILKPLIVLSSDGAAATVIDASGVGTSSNVLILTGDAEFGRSDHGFTVTNTKNSNSYGIAIQGTDIKVRGNQVVNTVKNGGYGIQAQDTTETILIEGNQANGWFFGIAVQGSNKTVSKNQIWLNTVGIQALGGSVVGNVATANYFAGIDVGGAASAVGNATYGNSYGFIAEIGFTGVIQKNNIFGNIFCGLANTGAAGLAATNNYWGASTGPGPNPADDVCNSGGGTTTTTPFATSKFSINPTFEP